MAKPLTIAVSGMPGAGSSTTAKMLAKRLKLPHFSSGDFVKGIAAKALGKKKVPETERALKMWKSDLQTVEFNKKVDDAMVERARQGNVVIDGKLAIHFLKDIADYSVWLKCPMKVRAKRVAERDGIPYEKALKVTEQKEAAERSNFKKFYGIDTFDQEADANLVVDTSKLSPEEIIGRIESALAARKHDHVRKFM